MENQPHGWRVGRIVDPFGHHWEIGKPLPLRQRVRLDEQASSGGYDHRLAAGSCGCNWLRVANELVCRTPLRASSEAAGSKVYAVMRWSRARRTSDDLVIKGRSLAD